MRRARLAILVLGGLALLCLGVAAHRGDDYAFLRRFRLHEWWATPVDGSGRPLAPVHMFYIWADQSAVLKVLEPYEVPRRTAASIYTRDYVLPSGAKAQLALFAGRANGPSCGLSANDAGAFEHFVYAIKGLLHIR